MRRVAVVLVVVGLGCGGGSGGTGGHVSGTGGSTTVVPGSGGTMGAAGAGGGPVVAGTGGTSIGGGGGGGRSGVVGGAGGAAATGGRPAMSGTGGAFPTGGSGAPAAGGAGGMQLPGTGGRVSTGGMSSTGGIGGLGGSWTATGGATGTGGAAGSSVPMCLGPGGGCTTATECCVGETCTQIAGSNLCAANCLEGPQCASGCCAVVQEGAGSVCAPAKYCQAPTCSSPGDSCLTTKCCDGSMCVNDGKAMLTVCAAPCTAGTQCSSGCCVPDASGGSVCAPPSYCAAPAPTAGCANLVLIAADGQYLGDASSSHSAAEGICNTSSPYGNQSGSFDIHNTFSVYGSQYSLLSAYSPSTTTPPRLLCMTTSRYWNYVSKNTHLPNVLDPDLLCSTLAAAGY